MGFDVEVLEVGTAGEIDRQGGSPLPPLDGRLRSPKLDISGAVLEGVDIVLDDPEISSGDSAP